MKLAKVWFVCVLLTGCVAKNPVLTKSEWDKLSEHRREGGGAIFSLPQTRIELDYVVLQKTFTARKHTDVVDACQREDFAAANSICNELTALGITASARLSDAKSRYSPKRLCESDGGATEKRIEAATEPTWAANAVPDPKETYIVPLKRNYFQTFDFSLELSQGTISKGSLSTENLGTQELLGAVTQLTKLVIGGGAEAAAPPESNPTIPRPVFEARTQPTPSAQTLAEAKSDLQALQALVRNRDILVASNTDDALPSRSALLTELNAQITRATLAFTGVVKSKAVIEKKAVWIPNVSAPALGLAGSTITENPTPSFDACGDENKRRPRWLSLVVAEREMNDGLADLASGPFPASVAKGKGWPYRVPAERNIVYTECASYAEGEADKVPEGMSWSSFSNATCQAHDGKRHMLPQFGITLRLPEKTGGRKSVIAPEYAADGSLTKVVVNHVGESPTPLITAARDLLTPGPAAKPPSEATILKNEAELITARQALCRLVFAVDTTSTKCQGSNPPTELQEQP